MKHAALICVFILCVCIFASCGSDKDDSGAVYKAKIVHMENSYAVIVNVDENAHSADVLTILPESLNIFDIDGNQTDAAYLKSGMIVEISYDGLIMELFPMLLGDPTLMRVVEQADSLVDMYLSAISESISGRSSYDKDYELVALDLTNETKLLDQEKRALVWILGNRYEGNAISATYDQLVEEGIAIPDDTYGGSHLENGLVISIYSRIPETSDYEFTVDMSESAGISSGYTYFAELENHEWTYTMKNMHIS